MNILAIDIGGTTSRFANVTESSLRQLDTITVFKLATQENDIGSFDDLLTKFTEQKTSEFTELSNYDAIALSVPGPVYDHLCMPPNIPWDIDISQLKKNHRVFMINDFAAQAYACLLPAINNDFVVCQPGEQTQGERIGIIGAGTGLGHSTLLNDNGRYHVLPSECGHATFSFIGEQEQAFGEYLQQKLNVSYCVNDHIVNGRGIALLHSFLTQQDRSTEQIFCAKEENHQTLSVFSRFYGRVARNYCLTNCIDDRLIISGGLVAKNPELVSEYAFLDEFKSLTTEDYRPMLDNVSIVINRIDEIGVYGVAYYALTRLQ